MVELAKSWSAKFINYAPQLSGAILILVVGWWLAGRIKRLLRHVMTARHVDGTLISFLSQLCYWLIITLVVITSLGTADVMTTPLSAVLGASALAVGLALQNSLSNLAAGVLIILFRHFRVGDEIETGGVRGIVEEISIFSTNMRTFDNRAIIVPNGSILNAPVYNNTAKPLKRVDIVFNISYGSDLRKARQIILEILQQDRRTLPDPAPAVVVSNLGASSVDLTMRAWVKRDDFYDLYFYMLENVKLRFDEAGIEIPFPQRVVHLRPKD